ncbi:hypothetical protein TNCV_3611141 [Trichonephila clavipes]|nr:hypothetical protein TNCV_3611141 [Trichonephila clavipes]
MTLCSRRPKPTDTEDPLSRSVMHCKSIQAQSHVECKCEEGNPDLPPGQPIGVYDHTTIDKPNGSLEALFRAGTIPIPFRRRTIATPPGYALLNQRSLCLCAELKISLFRQVQHLRLPEMGLRTAVQSGPLKKERLFNA